MERTGAPLPTAGSGVPGVSSGLAEPRSQSFNPWATEEYTILIYSYHVQNLSYGQAMAKFSSWSDTWEIKSALVTLTHKTSAADRKFIHWDVIDDEKQLLLK